MSKCIIVNNRLYEIKDDELIHWKLNGKEQEDHKYISREWKNGKWVYTYEESKNEKKSSTTKKKSFLESLADALGITARKEYKTAETKLESAKQYSEKATKEYNKARDSAYADNKISKSEQTNINSAKSKVDKYTSEVIKHGENYVKEKNEYMKTPLGAIETTVKSGVDFVKGIFDKISGKKSKDVEDKIKAEKEEYERKEKGKYVEDQTKEREGVRKTELKELLEKLTKPDTWFKKSNPLPELDLKKEPTTLDEDMALVNPSYKTDKENYDENCGLCSLTYDLRRRGYDVTVLDESVADGGLTYGDLLDCYKNTSGKNLVDFVDVMDKDKSNSRDMDTVKSYMNKELLSHGEGSRGILMVQWSQGGGHGVAWEVENGAVVIRDCQTNQKSDFSTWEYFSYVNDMSYIRTDNLEPNENITKYVRNRKG